MFISNMPRTCTIFFWVKIQHPTDLLNLVPSYNCVLFIPEAFSHNKIKCYFQNRCTRVLPLSMQWSDCYSRQILFLAWLFRILICKQLIIGLMFLRLDHSERTVCPRIEVRQLGWVLTGEIFV